MSALYRPVHLMRFLLLVVCLALGLHSGNARVAAQTQITDGALTDTVLRERLAGLSKATGKSISGARIAAAEFLPKLYAATGYKLAWGNPVNVE